MPRFPLRGQKGRVESQTASARFRLEPRRPQFAPEKLACQPVVHSTDSRIAPSPGYAPWTRYPRNRRRPARSKEIELLESDEHKIPVADVVNLYRGDAANQKLLRRVSELPTLPNSWREYFRKRLWNPDDK